MVMMKVKSEPEPMAASLEGALDALTEGVLAALIEAIAKYSDGFQKSCRVVLDSKERYAISRPKFQQVLRLTLAERLLPRYRRGKRFNIKLAEHERPRLKVLHGPVSYLCFEIGPEEASGGTARFLPPASTREAGGEEVPF